MNQFIRLAAHLSFFGVTTVRFYAEGKVLVGQNNYNDNLFFSATAERRRRYLQEKEEQEEEDKDKDDTFKEDEKEIGSIVEDVVGISSNSNGENKDEYVPHPSGTPVRFQDQDGTWMSGTIVNFNSDSKNYTIQWDEDDMKEEFSDLGKVNTLVKNAKNNDKDKDNDEEDDEGYDWNNDEEDDEDVPASSKEKNTSNNYVDKNNNNNNNESSSSSSSYQGTVPENFDFGYTYKYEDLKDYDPWPIGTLTLLEFQDGYYEGMVTSFELSEDNKVVTYVVTWSDDTTDKFVNELEWMDLMVENAKEYDPLGIGTQTYGYPNPKDGSNDPYLLGEITSFENGAYAVTWSNGDVVVYNDFDMIDALVSNAGMYYDPTSMANYDPWPLGTPVSWDFDDGWWDGAITGFADGSYEVTWSDQSLKNYSNLEKIDQMVQYAVGDEGLGDVYDGSYGDFGDDYEYYPVDTIVYTEFEDGWWMGHVDSYDGDYYVIRWSDNTFDNFLPGPEVDEMVENSQYLPFEESGIYPIGTQLYSKFQNAWYWGSVEYNAGGLYTVLWEDGERTYHMSGPEMDKMVASAAHNQGMSTVGAAFLTLFIAGSFAAIVFFFVRRSNRKKKVVTVTEQVKESELNLAEENGLVTKEENETIVEYSDKLDAEGTIKPAVLSVV